ncbi:MAG: hypothetical protein JO113_06035 [Candidatus Eremiobacteraeota bacterium]|nr:hypothetical protein [Candidatus Eremiobacteraeota bacterium]
MSLSRLGRFPLAAYVAGAVLSACGGAQPTPAAPAAAAWVDPQLQHGHPRGWMRADTSSQDLLYISADFDGVGVVYVYTYPSGQLVGELTGFSFPQFECVDSAGDIFIPSVNESPTTGTIYEYAHGGATPTRMLRDPGAPGGCSIDPTTGNLAVANLSDANNPHGNYGSIAVFAGSQSNPQTFYPSGFAPQTCGYDNQGNLYMSTGGGNRHDLSGFARLAKGSSSFEPLKLNAKISFAHALPSVQWDGKHMTVSSNQGPIAPLYVYRLKIRGDRATVIGTITLHDSPKENHSGQSWIVGRLIFGIDYHLGYRVSRWPYPQGGYPEWNIKHITTSYLLNGLVLSPGSASR